MVRNGPLTDALAPLINVRRGADGDKLTPTVTKCQRAGHERYSAQGRASATA